MTLHRDWVDMIHTKLLLTYGKRFTDQYAGLQPEHVKADWALELAHVTAEGIKHALHNLPREWPPTVLQFRDLCNRRPEHVTHHLLPVKGRKPTPEEAQRLRNAVARLGSNKEPLRWAYRLRDMEARGESLSRVQRTAWRVALKAEGYATEEQDHAGKAHADIA